VLAAVRPIDGSDLRKMELSERGIEAVTAGRIKHGGAREMARSREVGAREIAR
jgi:hypothetical protein